MLTHAQQLAAAALTLALGLLAVAAARRLGPRRGDRPGAAWALTGWCFLLVGGTATVHALLAAAATLAGEGSALYAAFLPWVGPANLARAVVAAVYAAALLVLLLARRSWAGAVAGRAPLVMLAGGFAALLAARATDVNGHEGLSLIALLGAATALVTMAALLAAVANDGLDQLLWFSLAAYALKEVVNTSLMATLVWWPLGDAGPILAALRTFYWISIGVLAVMCLLAWRRLVLAAAGRRVPALFERLHALRAPAADWTRPR